MKRYLTLGICLLASPAVACQSYSKEVFEMFKSGCQVTASGGTVSTSTALSGGGSANIGLVPQYKLTGGAKRIVSKGQFENLSQQIYNQSFGDILSCQEKAVSVAAELLRSCQTACAGNQNLPQCNTAGSSSKEAWVYVGTFKQKNWSLQNFLSLTGRPRQLIGNTLTARKELPLFSSAKRPKKQEQADEIDRLLEGSRVRVLDVKRHGTTRKYSVKIEY